MPDKDDGGPAFPVLFRNSQGDWVEVGGMSLRDYFAGQAMIGYMTEPYWRDIPHKVAFEAYSAADAMLAEREK